MPDRLFQLEQRILQFQDESYQQMVDNDVLEEDAYNNRLLDLKQSLELFPDLDESGYAAAYGVGSRRRQRRDRSQPPEPDSRWDNQERKRYYPDDKSIPETEKEKFNRKHQNQKGELTDFLG